MRARGRGERRHLRPFLDEAGEEVFTDEGPNLHLATVEELLSALAQADEEAWRMARRHEALDTLLGIVETLSLDAAAGATATATAASADAAHPTVPQSVSPPTSDPSR